MAMVIEFYKTYYVDHDPGVPRLCDAISSLVGESHIYNSTDYCRDLHYLTSLNSDQVAGVFRKLRPDDGIEYGEAGNDGQPLGLADNEGIFKTNHFVYFVKYDIVGYVRNKSANHYSKFRNCLTHVLGRRIDMVQLLSNASISEFLDNKKVFELSYQMPVSPLISYDDSNLWSDQALKALSKSGCDKIDLTIKVERRKNNGWLQETLENISNIIGLGATKAEVKAENLDGEELSVIDFIATKIIYRDSSFSYTKDKLKHEDIYNKIV